MHIDIDKILEDTCYKLPKGYPTVVNGVFTEREEVLIINEVLEAKGLPTLPLPPISKIKKPLQYTLGMKTGTGTKEGMVMYFATQADEVLQLVVEKLNVNYSMSLKLPTNEIKTDKYDGSPKAATDTIHNIQLLNKSKLPFNQNDKESYLNAISSARQIVQSIGILDPVQVDRGVVFTKIRKKAKDLLVNVNKVDVEPDKWNPGDIYVYGGSIPTGINGFEQLNNVDNSLNTLFMDTFKYPDDGKILAISLKEGEARGGKATSFRKILTKDENYPNVQDLSPVLDKLKDVITQFNASKFYRNSKNSNFVNIYGELSDAEFSLDGFEGALLDNNKTVVEKYGLVVSNLLLSMQSVLYGQLGKKSYKKGMGKKNLAALKFTPTKNAFNYNSAEWTKLDKDFLTFTTEVLNLAYNAYLESHNEFTSAAKEKKYNVSGDAINKPKQDDGNITNMVELFLKKANCYIVATDLIKNFAKKLNVPIAFASLAEQKDPFLAFAAFAMSQSGISPTFFKLIGKETGDTSDPPDIFPSDGILIADGTALKIIDSSEAKQVLIEFTVAQKSKQTKAKFKVELAFQYSGTQFKIEIGKIIHTK